MTHDEEPIYCSNSLCEWEAVVNVGTDEEPKWLCAQCAESYRDGQASRVADSATGRPDELIAVCREALEMDNLYFAALKALGAVHCLSRKDFERITEIGRHLNAVLEAKGERT